MVHCIYWGLAGYKFIKMYVFLGILVFVLANIEDPDEMLHFAAFHLALHCLQKYPFRGFQ